ncbi:MAG: MBL fold metallo-hydrolase [Bacilli bacterium]
MSKIIITSLGTISPYTKRNMNCPGFLVEYNNKKILLDCGNGITRLLNLLEDLKDLSVIVTHYHKDHFGDIGALQYTSYVYHNLGLLDKKIRIYLPKNDIGFNKASIISNNESYSDYYDINDSYSFSIDDLNITFENNNSHTIESYMVKLQNKDFKIVYTSDIGTTNLSKLVDFCKDSDLIICESSFLRKHNANSRTHMTAYDAGILASKSNAQKLLLTHFWPEEDKKLYLEEAKQNFENVEVAEEGKKLILRR